MYIHKMYNIKVSNKTLSQIDQMPENVGIQFEVFIMFIDIQKMIYMFFQTDFTTVLRCLISFN